MISYFYSTFALKLKPLINKGYSYFDCHTNVLKRSGSHLGSLYALTRQTANSPVRGLTVDTISAQPDPEIERQRSLFQALKDGLGEASPADIDAILAVRVASALRNREVVTCEPELTTETIDSPRERLRQRLRAKLQAAKH